MQQYHLQCGQYAISSISSAISYFDSIGVLIRLHRQGTRSWDVIKVMDTAGSGKYPRLSISSADEDLRDKQYIAIHDVLASV